MIKTKIQKSMAIAAVAAISATTIGSAATQIGTGSVTTDSSLDTAIMWNETFTAESASGSVDDIMVLATVAPTLSMEISTGVLNLGDLVAGVESTASLDIEIGTNAANGANITARSANEGLMNTSDNTQKIQDNQNGTFDDGIDESYKYVSAINAAADSTVSGFTQTADLDAQVNDDTTEHTVYTSDKPQQADGVNDITFTVKAITDAQTAAGNYEDNITFTVTGNF